MREADFAPFAQHLADIWGLKGQVLNGGGKALWFRALQAYSLDAIRAALDAYLRDPSTKGFLPMPSDIIGRLDRADGRPGAEEAWAMAVGCQDEAVTVVWTEETSRAMGLCRPILLAGDEVGARMAFREAYERLVAEARSARRPVAWSVSLGMDPEGRRVAIEAAQAAGLLPAPAAGDAPLALPAPRGDVLTPLTQAAPAEAKAALLRLRQSLTEPRAELPSRDAQARERADDAKKVAQERVAAAFPDSLHDAHVGALWAHALRQKNHLRKTA
jgi:hypothetical protein